MNGWVNTWNIREYAAQAQDVQHFVFDCPHRYGTLRNGAIPRKSWVQDGAPAHLRILLCDRLQQLFPTHVCGLGHNQVYPPRSPDLTAVDFYL